ANPDVVKRLLAYAEAARNDLGDALTKRTGTGARDPGRLPEKKETPPPPPPKGRGGREKPPPPAGEGVGGGTLARRRTGLLPPQATQPRAGHRRVPQRRPARVVVSRKARSVAG